MPIAPRNTRQKAAIRRAFEDAKRPLSVQEALDLAKVRVDGLGVATVYRNLRALVADGWLIPVEMPGGVVLYECAGKEHHHHFRCDSCHRVFELEGCSAAIDQLASPGFQVRAHELILFGVCSGCHQELPPGAISD